MMHRKPTYRVYVEEGQGGAMAHVAELPGCFTAGSSASRAVAATPKAIRDFLVWLRAHREPLVPEAHVSRPNLADLSVSSKLKVQSSKDRPGFEPSTLNLELSLDAPLQAGSKATLFDFDKAAWDDEKLERTLRWLRYSRADLLAAIEGMSEADMKARQVAPGRTLWDTLWHVANTEYGYINRVAGPLDASEPVTEDEPAYISERLATIRDILERKVREIPTERRAEVVYPSWGGSASHSGPDEPWTLQKALRRALEHELEHLRELN